MTEIQIEFLGEDATKQIGYLKEFIEYHEIDGLEALEIQRAATTRGLLSYATFSNMKKVILSMILLGTMAFVGQAQTFPALDKTPMDMVYYPDEYAHDRKFAPTKIGADKAMIRLTYNRPAKKEREIFGKLVPYGKVWRTGANEAPEIKFYQPVVIGGKKIAAGSYALLAIPGEKEWTIIISSDVDQWGAYSYSEALDVARVSVPVQPATSPIEHLSCRFVKKDAKTALLYLGWDTTVVAVPIEIEL